MVGYSPNFLNRKMITTIFYEPFNHVNGQIGN